MYIQTHTQTHTYVDFGCEMCKCYCLLLYENALNEQHCKYYCVFRRDGNGLNYSYFSYNCEIICTR